MTDPGPVLTARHRLLQCVTSCAARPPVTISSALHKQRHRPRPQAGLDFAVMEAPWLADCFRKAT
jgi:hypothetical protein